VGRFLFSQNLAIFLNYCTKNATSYVWNDIILTVLLFTANLIIYQPVKEEYVQTRLYKWWSRRNSPIEIEPSDSDKQLLIKRRNESGGSGGSAAYPPS